MIELRFLKFSVVSGTYEHCDHIHPFLHSSKYTRECLVSIVLIVGGSRKQITDDLFLCPLTTVRLVKIVSIPRLIFIY